MTLLLLSFFCGGASEMLGFFASLRMTVRDIGLKMRA
jgi:hypothetical protein